MMDEMEISGSVDDAMINSYDFIIEGKTLEILLEENPNALLLIFDPDEYNRVEVIEDLIIYFEESEEYEKCGILKGAKKDELL